jgi:hypothetical protein
MKIVNVIAAVLAVSAIAAAPSAAADRSQQAPPISNQPIPGLPPRATIFCADPAVTMNVGAPTFAGGVFRVAMEAKICNVGNAVLTAPAGDELKLVINGIAEKLEGGTWKFLNEMVQYVELHPYLAQLKVNECRTLPWAYSWTVAAGKPTAGLTSLASGPADGKFRAGVFAFASNAKNQMEPLNPTYPTSLNCNKANDNTKRVYLYLK